MRLVSSSIIFPNCKLRFLTNTYIDIQLLAIAESYVEKYLTERFLPGHQNGIASAREVLKELEKGTMTMTPQDEEIFKKFEAENHANTTTLRKIKKIKKLLNEVRAAEVGDQEIGSPESE